jgi:hypothetical protein
VYGPGRNPSWERYATHPALFLAAAALGAAIGAAGWQFRESIPELFAATVMAAGGVVVGSVFVLGICSGYFTRLVVTNRRIVILQGYEVCRTWGVDELPPRLIRRRMRLGEPEAKAVDLDTLKTMIGGSSEGIVEAKTILAFGKQLGKGRGRP